MASGASSELNLNTDNLKPRAALHEYTRLPFGNGRRFQLQDNKQQHYNIGSNCSNNNNNLMTTTAACKEFFLDRFATTHREMKAQRPTASLLICQSSKPLDINSEFSSSSISTVLLQLTSSFLSAPMGFNVCSRM
ncbi:hypothetical protein DITRI_Ditri13aG0131300 [Diplodiscus trichospermus]